MKKFSLKKITAAVSAAVMIATMGTSVFAASPVSAGQDGDGITITDVTVTQRESGSKLYDVSVTYTTSVAQEIGTTMLTYVKHGNSLTSVEAYNDSTMKIVGVDQKNDTSAFTFTVTTDSSASNGIYMVPGESGLLMLSGDKVTAPAVAVLTIYATAKSTATVDVGTVNVAANLNEAGVKAALTTKAQAETVDIMDAADDETVAKANVSLSGAEFTWTQDSNDSTKYVGKTTLTSVEGVNVPAGGIEVTANATVNKTAVEATGVALFDSKAKNAEGSFDISIQKGELTAGSEIDNMKDLIASKTAQIEVVSVDDNTERITSDVTLQKDNVATDATYADGTNKYSFVVTIPSTSTHTNNMVIIPESGFTFNVDVTVTEKPAITSIIPKTGLGATYDYNVSETDTFTVDKIAAKLKEVVAGDTTAVTYTSGTDSEDATLADFDYAWNVTISADGNTATAKLVVTGIKTAAISDVYSIDSVEVATVTVNKKEKPAFTYGDPVVDEEINISDVIYAFDHIGEDVNESVANMACDVVQDDEINITDVIEIFDNIGVDLDKTGFPKK